MSTKITAADIRSTFKGVDVSAYTQSRSVGNRSLSWLPWADAWAILTEYYPGATYTFKPAHFYPDGSAEVECAVSIPDGDGDFIWQSCTLAVMDNRYDAIQTPSSRDINDARWRCVVKAIATMTGLGLQLYRDGSGVPKPIEVKTVKPPTAAEKRKQAAAEKKAKEAAAKKLEDSLEQLSQLVAACEEDGNVDAKGIEVARKYLGDRGPLARVEDAIKYLEAQLGG